MTVRERLRYILFMAHTVYPSYSTRHDTHIYIYRLPGAMAHAHCITSLPKKRVHNYEVILEYIYSILYRTFSSWKLAYKRSRSRKHGRLFEVPYRKRN